MKKIFISSNYCKGCLICVACCPQKVLQACATIDARGYTLPEAGHPEKCNGCGLCEIVCPDFAIAVEKEDKAV
jgi:2-oxoglutarate ferredoxin oxidoreductase subunit delta